LTGRDTAAIKAAMAAPVIFDRQALAIRRRRALASPVAGADFLHRAAADDLLDRLGSVHRTFELAAEIGSPTAYLADALSALGTPVFRLDRVTEALAHNRHACVVADPEVLPLAPASIDLALSALELQWVNDLPGVLAQVRRALRPDGLFLANFLGGDTLAELRDSLTAAELEITGGASPRVAPFVELRSAGALLQRAGFALPVIDLDRRVVRYDSALHLIRDLRAMGAANPLAERDRRPLRRDVLARTVATYAERYSDPDGRVRATFDIISLSGWAPHESQQKPLRPGSASLRLANALNTVERSAGDKTDGKES
jgi:SAM-dependent methyltransferase